MLQSFMHTWNVEDYCTCFLQVFFLSKIPQEMYVVLEKHSFNLLMKNKRGRKIISTNTKKSSQVLNCNYKKLFPSACQLHSLSLLFGKFYAWFWLVGFFSQFLMRWLQFREYMEVWSSFEWCNMGYKLCHCYVLPSMSLRPEARLSSPGGQLLLAGDKIPLLSIN